MFAIADASFIEQTKRVENINSKIKESDSQFVFILDNLEEYQTVEVILANLPLNKVKIIITSRNKIIIPEQIGSFESLSVGMFDSEEIKEYLQENLDTKIEKDIEKIRILIEKRSVGVFGPGKMEDYLEEHFKEANEKDMKRIKKLTDKRIIEVHDTDEISKYLKDNFKEANKQVMEKISQLLGKFSNKILPLELRLIVYNVNELFADDIDELLKSINDTSSYPTLPDRLEETEELDETERKPYRSIQECLFEKLRAKNIAAFSLLLIFAYLDPDYISYEILKYILKLNPNYPKDQNGLSKSIKNIEQYGLIEHNKKENTIRLHRLIQTEVKIYSNKICVTDSQVSRYF